MADKPRCTATTKAGDRCKSAPQHGQNVCLAHDQEARESGRFGGAQPGAGRPKAPRAVDVLRERLEERIDEVLDPLFAALEADSGLVVGNGKDAYVEVQADHRTRISAVRELLDRAYGKPKQQTEITGKDGGAIVNLAVPLDAASKSQKAAALLATQGLIPGSDAGS